MYYATSVQNSAIAVQKYGKGKEEEQEKERRNVETRPGPTNALSPPVFFFDPDNSRAQHFLCAIAEEDRPDVRE
jgi:hypothetical protein